MSTTVKAGSNIPPVPAGMHHAVNYAIIDIGTQQPSNQTFRPSKQVVFVFELPNERYPFERDGKKVELPRAISLTRGASLGRKANLRRDLEAWRGRAFTEQELNGFDLKNVLGANCQLNVIHVEKNGKIFANIAGIAPLAKGMTKANPENPTLVFDLDEFIKTGGGAWPANLPEWLKAKIMLSDEYLMAMQTEGQPPPATEGATESVEKDDIPF